MTQEALKLALEFIENSECGTADLEARIKEALAQTQEPVKMVAYNCTCGRTMKFESVHGVVAPQRTWVGLTDEEKKDLCRWWSSPMDAIYATEAKLKQKNGYAEENT